MKDQERHIEERKILKMNSLPGIAYFAFIIFYGVLSATQAYAGGWDSALVKVTRIVIEAEDDGRRVYVQFSNNSWNPDNCPSPGWIRIFGDTQKGKNLYSLVLSAYLSGKDVTRGQNGCDDWGRPVLYGVIVQN